jgi:hypothetical protein
MPKSDQFPPRVATLRENGHGDRKSPASASGCDRQKHDSEGCPGAIEETAQTRHGMSPSKDKPEISEHEAEELIKGMGRVATVVVHDNGLAIATAISTNPSDTTIQNEVDGFLHDIQRKYCIVKKRR